MQRQNSSASQTDINTEVEASCNARHSKKKEKYTVGMLIAEGNYAVVKQCKEKASNRRFVLRVINKAKVFMREDLINIELKIMKSLRHENILQVVDNWETSDEFCLILEQIEVGNSSQKSLWSQICTFVPDVCCGSRLYIIILLFHCREGTCLMPFCTANTSVSRMQ